MLPLVSSLALLYPYFPFLLLSFPLLPLSVVLLIFWLPTVGLNTHANTGLHNIKYRKLFMSNLPGPSQWLINKSELKNGKAGGVWVEGGRRLIHPMNNNIKCVGVRVAWYWRQYYTLRLCVARLLQLLFPVTAQFATRIVFSNVASHSTYQMLLYVMHWVPYLCIGYRMLHTHAFVRAVEFANRYNRM